MKSILKMSEQELIDVAIELMGGQQIIKKEWNPVNNIQDALELTRKSKHQIDAKIFPDGTYSVIIWKDKIKPLAELEGGDLAKLLTQAVLIARAE